ncbi:MAG TPA: hypothetical protein VEV13_07375 [Candidatus Limnocylindria bacterium]|jgi:hypothetical protein|nr:hypothetical protein [Candidatus Limnocylindria bacterium]
MSRLLNPFLWLDQMVVRLAQASRDRERGDVPGWVLVTVMTAGLVTAIWLVADDQLTNIFSNAVEGVTGP